MKTKCIQKIRNILDTKKINDIQIKINEFTIYHGYVKGIRLTVGGYLDLGDDNTIFLSDKVIHDIYVSFGTLWIKIYCD